MTSHHTPNNYPVTEEVLQALEQTKRGCEELIVEADWVKKLAKSHATQQPLRIKLGLDPTAPDIHLGHTVVLNKLRQLQDLGHTVIFLIGDFTSMIGDPSGRSEERNLLDADTLTANVANIKTQLERLLDDIRLASARAKVFHIRIELVANIRTKLG